MGDTPLLPSTGGARCRQLARRFMAACRGWLTSTEEHMLAGGNERADVMHIASPTAKPAS